MNENWPRWLFASITKFFDTNKSTLSMYFEGLERNSFQDLPNFVEVRIDGPYFTEVSKGNWKTYVEVNALVQSHISETDFHKIHKDVGKVVTIFDNSIPLYKYGDDSSLFGCLDLLQSRSERIQVSHFGQIDPDKRLMQATVEGHYQTYLEV